ncbi:MarR family winged helix-turn-helix transcriptional regulator [Mangrovitalea sediminis]|uniref:MarR family winged helix-turn-helix transcriptional regulator n=1 Tax=Mangrovitalea sediminis TaxID=1982043 RepID=UPI000BE61A59|nr:MarR family transcriptional regulator [Mangrovitalea sediminis]
MTENTEQNFGFLLSDAARLLRRNFDRRAKTLNLNRAQWSVLARLARNEGVKQTVLADILEVSPITLARQIDRLEAGGWVKRQPDPQDRRANRLYLTPKAGPMLDELRSRGNESRAEALAGLSEQERAQLVGLLARVRENLAREECLQNQHADK